MALFGVLFSKQEVEGSLANYHDVSIKFSVTVKLLKPIFQLDHTSMTNEEKIRPAIIKQ